MNRPFTIVDVFAESKYAGNQLAVVKQAAGLGTAEMQSIAREWNFAETTFLASDEPREGGYDVRIFTPAAEVPFAGHPTLGTAWVIRDQMIRDEIANQPVDRVILNLQVGQIPVTFDGDVLWMQQIQPRFGQTRTPAQLAPLLGLAEGDFDTRFPIQDVSTGLPFLLIPLRGMDAVRRARVNLTLLKEFIATLDAKMLFIFSPQTYSPDHHINARMFGDEFGVAEDPATGSANGCLAAYLVKYRYFGSYEINVQIEQGYEIKRPSILRLRASEQNGTYDINVGGKVFMVARGELV